MNDISTRPYLIRAIYDWCVDQGFTPYLAVRVNEQTEVPVSFVKDGEIVLNLSAGAVRNLEVGNEWITCNGRFGGTAFDLIVPVIAVMGIFAKENGQGMVFPETDAPQPPPDSTTAVENKPKRGTPPTLRIVK